MRPLIYVVEDEKSIQELYTCSLDSAQMDVKCYFSDDEMRKDLIHKKPNLFILDIMLDGKDGYQILESLKNDPRYAAIPVIMVSAKNEEVNKVKGLNLGADDYMSKPFGIMELIARINANLRKSIRNPNDIQYNEVVVKESEHAIYIGDVSIELTLKEYNLLKLLVENAGQVISREDILNIIWGTDFGGETRTLDMHIKEIRKKLASAESQSKIETIRGVGYILK